MSPPGVTALLFTGDAWRASVLVSEQLAVASSSPTVADQRKTGWCRGEDDRASVLSIRRCSFVVFIRGRRSFRRLFYNRHATLSPFPYGSVGHFAPPAQPCSHVSARPAAL